MRQHCQGMRKRYVIALSLFLSAVLPCHAGESRPNILFFFADDQRHDTLGCAGHKIVETPTIDRLANSGVRFENMFVTRSTCWASRTTILTGLTSRSAVEPDLSDRVKPGTLTEMFPDLLRASLVEEPGQTIDFELCAALQELAPRLMLRPGKNSRGYSGICARRARPTTTSTSLNHQWRFLAIPQEASHIVTTRIGLRWRSRPS